MPFKANNWGDREMTLGPFFLFLNFTERWGYASFMPSRSIWSWSIGRNYKGDWFASRYPQEALAHYFPDDEPEGW